MALEHVPRCQHVKVNGVQCGSPALRSREHCYFHTRADYERRRAIESKDGKRTFGFPLLEDANSIQVALMKVIQMLGEGSIEEKKASVMIYALQTASNNLRHLKLEPEKLTDVVIDEDTVDLTQISGPQWASRDFPASPAREVEELVGKDLGEESLESDVAAEGSAEEHLVEGDLAEPDLLDRDLVDRDFLEEERQNRRGEASPAANVNSIASASPGRAKPAANPASARAAVARKPAAVDPAVADAVRRREQKRKLTRDLQGDEQDSLAATLLRRMGLPVELEEEDARRVEEARRT